MTRWHRPGWAERVPWWAVLALYCGLLSFLSCLIWSSAKFAIFPLTTWFLNSPFAVSVAFLVGIPVLLMTIGLDILLLLLHIPLTGPTTLIPLPGWLWAAYLIYQRWITVPSPWTWGQKAAWLAAASLGSSGLGYAAYLVFLKISQ